MEAKKYNGLRLSKKELSDAVSFCQSQDHLMTYLFLGESLYSALV